MGLCTVSALTVLIMSSVLLLPTEPVHIQRRALVDIVLTPRGDVVVWTTLIATLTVDGRVLDSQGRERAHVASDGTVVLAGGAGRMEIDDVHAIVRTHFRATRETEVDAASYMARFERPLWRSVLLAFFIDLVLMATDEGVVAAARHGPT